MKTKIISGLLIIFTVLICQNFVIAQQTDQAVVKVKQADVRERPDANSKIIRRLPENARVKIISSAESGEWVQISFEGSSGWLPKSLLKHQETAGKADFKARRVGILITEPVKPNPIRAAVWRNIETYGDTAHQINDSEILNRGDFISLWVRKSEGSTIRELNSYDIKCAENMYRYRGKIEYGTDGKITNRTAVPPEELNFEAIRSETLLEKVRIEACQVDAGPATASPLYPLLSPETDATGTGTITGGVINGRAISLPKPDYPQAARLVGAKGAVSVQVLIDEYGRIIRARAVRGHPLLRKSAENAAGQALFPPTKLDGQPVKVSGIITYVFN